MKFNNKFILISILLIALALSFSAVSAADLETVQTGEVSGGVDVVSSNPGIEYGELNYEIPENVEDLEYAGLFIDCYTAGSYNTVYGSEANVTLTSNGETEQIANERLVASVGSADGAVYEINDHTTKCFADYFMTYNLTDKLQNASGTITINVTTAPIEDYTFYNKIKLIGLVFAYNDDDGDKLDYWVNAGSAWSKTDTGETTKSTFDLGTVGDGVSSATLDNFALSSQDGIYTFNGEELDDSLIFETGVYYYIHHKFDIIEKFKNGTNTLVYTPGEGSYSFRNVLSVISLNRPLPSSAKASLSSEYDGAVFAGSDNALKLNLTNDGERNANYIVELYADGAKLDAGIFKDGVKLNGSEVYVKMGSDAVLYLLDDTIRPVTKDTVYGEKNAKVNYTVVVREKDSGDVLTESTITPALLYNGYLSKDLAYLSQNISLFDTISVSGGVIINTLDDSTYLGTKTTGRTDKWTLDIPKDGSLANGFIYLVERSLF